MTLARPFRVPSLAKAAVSAVVLLTTFQYAPAVAAPPSAQTASASVVRVVDGDTVVVRTGSAQRTVRIIGVDTPETKKPGSPVECFGPEASRFTTRLLPPGTKVTLTFDAERTDRFGRTLAYLTRARDRLDVGATLLAKGYARTLVIAPNTLRATAYSTLAKRARDARLGLWGRCSVTTSSATTSSATTSSVSTSSAARPAVVSSVPPVAAPSHRPVPSPSLARTIFYGSSERQWLSVITPAGPPRGVVAFVHGGAWIAGSAEWQNVPRELLDLASNGWAVATVEYTLAPVAAEPTQVREVQAAVALLAERYGGPVVLAGSSAGGHIASLAALGERTVAGVVLLAAPGDLSLLAQNPDRVYGYTLAGVVSTALGCSGIDPDGQLTCDRDRLEASDVTARLDFSAPPAFIAYGDRDTIVTPAQSRDLAAAWSAAVGPGRVWVDVVEGADHGLSGVDSAALSRFLELVAVGALLRVS